MKADRRVLRTQTALARALIELVEERDLPRISIADVAERAGVSRSTFYDHYRDVHELAEAACTAMIDGVIESLPVPSSDAVHEASRSLEAFFASLAAHAGLYRALLGPQGSARVLDHIRRRLTAAVHGHLQTAALAAHPAPGAAPQSGPADVGVRRAGELPRGWGAEALEVAAAFTAGAMVGVAVDWIQGGCARTPAEMARLTWPLFSALYAID